jgi:hypothetical protein
MGERRPTRERLAPDSRMPQAGHEPGRVAALAVGEPRQGAESEFLRSLADSPEHPSGVGAEPPRHHSELSTGWG